MSRRRRNRGPDATEAVIKLGLFGLLFAAFAIGGIKNFAGTLIGLILLLAAAAAVVGVVWIVIIAVVRHSRQQSSLSERFLAAPPATRPRGTDTAHTVPEKTESTLNETAARYFQPATSHDRAPSRSAGWDAARIRAALETIDWYQFEKFCAALLRADGFDVERKGGAQPDGGVDLVVRKGEQSALIQCKHWRNWVVQERVVREMLGSMTHFGVRQGAIYTLKGWTKPAEQFAQEHAITLVSGDELAASAAFQLTQSQLDTILQTDDHHCPKCESLMVWRTGNFDPFWGCSRYPRCRGKLKHTGAR